MRPGSALRPAYALARLPPVARQPLCTRTPTTMPPRQQPTLGSFFGQQATRKLAASSAPGEQAPLSTFFGPNHHPNPNPRPATSQASHPTQPQAQSTHPCSTSASAESDAQAGRKRSASASNDDDAPPKSRARQEEDSESDHATTPERRSPPPTNKETASVTSSLLISQDGKEDGKSNPSATQSKPLPFSVLAETFAAIEATTKRLEILQLLSQFYCKVIEQSPDDLIKVVYLCINRIAPEYEGIELGVGEGILVKAIATSTGRDIKKIKTDLSEVGDLGSVAVLSRKRQPTMFRSSALAVNTVFVQLRELAAMSGTKSQDRKMGIITRLLSTCQGDEAKYLIRMLEGKLRIGLAEKSVITALGQAASYEQALTEAGSKTNLDPATLISRSEKGVMAIREVYSQLPSYDLIIPALLEAIHDPHRTGGVTNLAEKCKLTPGVPLKPMLAKPTKAIGEVLDKFEGIEFTCEYKYDGERAQVHLLPDGSLRIFSRNSEDMSVKYPDMVPVIPKITVPDQVSSFILDCEAVAWNVPERDDQGTITKDGHMLPFQELSRRKRKDVKVEDIKVRVKLFAFDLIYLNGQALLDKQLSERRQLLQKHFHAVPNEFDFATAKDCHSTEEIQAFLDQSIADGCEGLMVKTLNGSEAQYKPSQRSTNWLKLKKDYFDGVGDSLDLVVIGAFYGKGKRTSVYGAFLLACYDPDDEVWQTICKIGTGFSEEQLTQLYDVLKPTEISGAKGYYAMGDAKPDVFFEPKTVFEVRTADLSLSPVYAAARGLINGEKRGISLRFPRFSRLRDDKGADEATSAEQVADMYRAQQSVQSKGNTKGHGAAATAAEDDFW